MFLPDKLLLSKIQTQNVYCDKDSLEKTTSVIKHKYKIAGNILSPLNIYAFFITTTNKDACQKSLTVTIESKHWESRLAGYLNEAYTYVDIRKIELLTDLELLKKMRDSTNGFPCVARLCDIKYRDMQNLRNHAHTSKSYLPLEKTTLIKMALDEIVDTSHIADDILKKLGSI